MAKAKIVYKKIADLVPYENNARTHSEAQTKQIAASITEFGWTNPILIDSKNGIIAGHGRALAATLLGMDEAPCISITGLTDAQKRALIIADNKLAMNASWDEDMLKIELQDLEGLDFDLSMIGFDVAELKELFSDTEFAPGSEIDQGTLDQLTPKICQCPNCGEEFDARGHEKK